MNDLISRQTAVDALILLQDHSDMPEDWHKGVSASVSCLFRVPFVERKKGKWIKPTRVPDSMLEECSVCGFDCGAYTFNYCPNCGADMRGET